MSIIYLLALTLSIAGLIAADYRYKLAFFYDARRTLLSVAIGVTIFLIWDVAGIALDIFFVGNSAYLTGIRVLPEVPIEELLFLTLLCYVSLLSWRKFANP